MKFIYLLLLMTSIVSLAQIKQTDDLFVVLKKLDAELFEQGFNQCHLENTKDIVTDDLEFYHDKGGFSDKAMFLKAMKDNICSSPNHKTIRKLINDSLEVFPLYKDGILYAAMQKGIHEFYIKEPNKEIYPTGMARFTHLWVLDNKQWKLKRILSYDHKPIDAKFEKLNAHYPIGLFDTDAGINSLLKQHYIPSIGIGIINHGKLQQIRLFGDKKKGSPVSYNTIYKIASLTKPIVALITLKLIDANKLKLDEPLYHYYIDPDIKGTEYIKLLTPRIILSHQTGFPNWRYLDKDNILKFEFKPGTKYHYYIDPDIKDTEYIKLLTPRIILSHQTGFPNWRYLDKDNILKFEFKPGTKYQYSGEGFEFLRKALESKFNKPIEQLAQELLFKPLKMQDTHFTWDKGMDENRYAQEHDEMGKPIDFKKHQQVNAAANLLTTIEDYSKFMVHILNGSGLSKKLYQEMITKQVNEKPGIDFGLGWEIFNDIGQGEFALQHTGGDYGIKTLALLLPKSKRGIVIFVNSENGIKVWGKIIREYFGKIGEKIIEMNKQ